jgi:hypothetical protein
MKKTKKQKGQKKKQKREENIFFNFYICIYVYVDSTYMLFAVVENKYIQRC